MSENTYFQDGYVESPITSSTANSLLQDADPAIYYMLDYFKAVIELHCQARWNAEVALCNRTDLVNKMVASTFSSDPSFYMTDDQLALPLLAVYRKSAEFEQMTAVFDHTITKAEVLYVLPPLTPAQADRLLPMLKHVVGVIRDRAMEGFDSAYNSGAKVWQLAGIESMSIDNCTFDNMQSADGSIFLPTVTVNMTIKEAKGIVSGNFETLAGIDAQIDKTTPEDDDVTVAEFAEET
jgi:hypothetical protein